MSLSVEVGDRVKVIDQEIKGTIVEVFKSLIIISDDDAETNDDRLEFHVDDLEQIEKEA
jgi:hypothetical protein|tara:strand:+ start:147 stop:323 length:177 start_codon:yes stop_codon:yes gene_type:complete